MENISDYLYLVVVLAIGLLGALRKKRDNVARTKKIPETSDSGTGDTDEYELQEEVADIEPDDQFWRETVVDEVSYTDALAADYMNEGVSALAPEYSESIEIHKPDSDEISGDLSEIEEEESIAARIAKDFNLNEAIVYSEILNRKENF